MSWQSRLNADPLPWLLEADSPGVRYLTLRDLLDRSEDDPQLQTARTLAHQQGLIAQIVEAMHSDGYWEKPGPGYYPKYRGSVWSILMLAQLGATLDEEPRIGIACNYLLNHALTPNGQFSVSGTPSGTADCLQGNLCWALTTLGCRDPRLADAYAWMARSVTGDGVAPLSDKKAPLRYYAGKCGPNFACGSNNKLPCAWGAVKVMLAFSVLPQTERPPLIERAINQGIDFLFSVDPADATYPCGFSTKPSRNWWKFGFPLFYVTDLLQLVAALVQLGYGTDSRLDRALRIIREKQDNTGRWPLEYDYSGKTWVEFGPKKAPNKWVTLRALRVLKKVAETQEPEAVGRH